MMKRLWTLSLALLMLSSPAWAEVYSGTTASLSSVSVRADAPGILEVLNVQTGQRIETGQELASLRSEKAFATQDGTVSLICAEEGDSVNGEVLELMPVERYTIHCTVDKAYQSVPSTLVHSGETVYIKCTEDGSHRAIGIITEIDGAEFRVLTIGGELYVGETVYLYRDEDFTTAQRIGIGTAVTSDTQSYEAEGRLTLLRVTEGEYVERGQLLFATDGGTVCAPAGGILRSLYCQPGDSIVADQIIAEIVPEDAICVEIRADETTAAKISVGNSALLTFAKCEEEETVPGTVIEVFGIPESELYTVRIMPETDTSLCLGMSVEVRLE